MLVTSTNDLPTESNSHNPGIKKQVFVRNGEFGPITQFARSTLQPGDVAPAHSHPDMGEIFYVLAGTLTISLDGNTSTHGPGTSLAILPGETHELSNQSEDELTLLHLGAVMPPGA